MPKYKALVELPNGGESTNLTEWTTPDCQRIQQYAEALRIYLESDAELHRSEFYRQQTIFPEEVYTRLRQWVDGTSSRRMMWIEGPYSPGVLTLSNHIGVAAVDQVMDAQLPCIAHFCKSQYSFASESLSHRDAAVLSLFYSVIHQLAYLLPIQAPIADRRLDPQEFAKLDEKLKSVPAALNIIEALLEHAPPTIAWVIDGLQYAGDLSTNQLLLDFVELLRGQERKRIWKVVFTTGGRSQVLDRGIRPWERVDASGMVQARGGRAHPGGVFM
ncbi:hypothetical protein QBC41DRAFT_384622 [Cercophora samala]|uniref:Nephrocystin 3-like N-terminal domain-containing protein n=1 Tax=Cercophora samala TaxID=330535 RepID=A0AA39YW83_9PEZI|nr:hypothetical protein QBC41DRAFT_384622 [Cercophora samala]